ANLPTRITRGVSVAYFHYGSDRSRFKQVLTGSGSTETTRYVGGLYEHVNKGSLTTRRHSIYANGQLVALRITRSSGGNDTRYVYRDHLGSIDAFTRVSGEVVERLAYDAWGKRRQPDWSDAAGQQSSAVTPRGFTGHEHLDDARLIHLNGRVYYPALGRFISADPFVQFPHNGQSLNRYSYGYVLMADRFDL
ncbi:MAG: hypothetical protein H0V34_14755, partial [Gammaproteobacteria bacterium]|nr:hypothetical protein [Gammaproteobacteria bacterium]